MRAPTLAEYRRRLNVPPRVAGHAARIDRVLNYYRGQAERGYVARCGCGWKCEAHFRGVIEHRYVEHLAAVVGSRV